MRDVMRLEEYRRKITEEWIPYRRGIKEGIAEQIAKRPSEHCIPGMHIGSGAIGISVVDMIDSLFGGYFGRRRAKKFLKILKEDVSRIEKEIMFDLGSPSKEMRGYSKKLNELYQYIIDCDLENVGDDDKRLQFCINSMNEKARKLYPEYLKITKRV